MHTEEASFVSSHGLDNISILLDEDNDLEEEITHLFNELSTFFPSLKRTKYIHYTLNIFTTCTVIRGNFEQFQVCFLV